MDSSTEPGVKFVNGRREGSSIRTEAKLGNLGESKTALTERSSASWAMEGQDINGMARSTDRIKFGGCDRIIDYSSSKICSSGHSTFIYTSKWLGGESKVEPPRMGKGEVKQRNIRCGVCKVRLRLE